MNAIGGQRKLGDVFVLSKGKRQATCELWSHPIGWELRMKAAGRLLAAKVCRTREDVFDVYDEWKATMMSSGWR